MKNLRHLATRSTYWLKVVSLGLILGLGIQFAQAWTNPTLTAPGGNVSGPITTGAGSQTKASGDISLSGVGSLYAGGVVAAPRLCIGADCRNVWPASGISSESDPTVLASVKDGVDWSEITNKPTNSIISTSGAAGTFCPANTYCNRTSGAGLCVSGVNAKVGGVQWWGGGNMYYVDAGDRLYPGAFNCSDGVFFVN